MLGTAWSSRLLPRFARPDGLAHDRLDPQSRAAVVFVVARFAVALIAAILLGTAAVAGSEPVSLWPLLVHLALVASASLVVPLVAAADDAGRARWVRWLAVTDVLAYAAYSVAFGSRPEAASIMPLFVLLAGPLLWSWRGLLVTALPVGVIAVLWPQRDATGQTTSAVQVLLLVVLLSVPAAAVSALVRRGSARLARAEEQFRTAFDDASSGMALLDCDGRILRANPALHTLLGIEELTGTSLHAHAADRTAFLAGLDSLSPARRASRFEVQLRRVDGGALWVSVVASAICSDGQVQRVLLQTEDVSERHRLQEQLSFEATHDALTGLPNLRVLHDRLEAALAEQRPSAVLFVDLDRFKLVNDSLGHAAGDRLLVAVGKRLLGCVRPGDLVVRLGGDEFVILCVNAAGPAPVDAVAVAVAERVVSALRPSHLTKDGTLSATGSVGVALATAGATVDTLVRDADTAMYAAKTAGGDRAAVFNDQLRLDVVRRHDMENALRDALRREELRGGLREDRLRLAYQPIVDGAGRVVAAEALLRWTFKGQAANPEEVIRIAEQSGLIADLGLHVLRQALLDSAAWPSDVRLHVNVSAHQLDDQFPAALSALLDETRTLTGRLCLELTETAMGDDMAAMVRRLEQIGALGIRLAIDDFGVGNASLTYLARLPVQDLKIDRSFITGLPGDTGSVAIVSAVVAMARAYGMQIIAEGVETREQDLTCVRLGCSQRQGYLHHRPMRQDALQDLWPERQARLPQPRPTLEGQEAGPVHR